MIFNKNINNLPSLFRLFTLSLSIMVKRLLFVLLVVFVISMTAEPLGCSCRRDPCQFPQETVHFSNLATPFPTFIEPIDYVPNCQTCGNCGCNGCNDQLILPPLSAEFPCGLGYFPSASSLVAKYFSPALDFLPTGAYIPVASPCNSLILAAPVSPDIASLIKPVIL